MFREVVEGGTYAVKLVGSDQPAAQKQALEDLGPGALVVRWPFKLLKGSFRPRVEFQRGGRDQPTFRPGIFGLEREELKAAHGDKLVIIDFTHPSAAAASEPQGPLGDASLSP